MQNTKLQEFNEYIKGRKVAIIGLGVSNTPLLEYFYNLGAKVTVFDNRTINKIEMESISKSNSLGIELITGEDSLKRLVGFDIIFRSPSCRPDLPEIEAELERGAILTSEIEMLIELCPGTVIGVTGSDGKTTTTSLIYEIINVGVGALDNPENIAKVYLGGNIGTPLFTKLPNMKEQDIVVLELSSFQLMTMQISPKISVITNISPNHLDIHKSYEEYIDSKKNIFKYQDKDGIVVLNYDDEIVKEFANEANGKVVFFSSNEKLKDGLVLDDNIIKLCENNLRKHLLNTNELKLRGKHNFENICTALSATRDLVQIDLAVEAVKDFKGVEHRLEFVREIDGVKWYNDSIGTSPSRTIAGLNSFEEEIILIAGGYDKHLDYAPIAKPIIDNVKELILFGATADKIENAIVGVGALDNPNTANINIYRCATLEETIQTAKKVAQKNQVVLFSPASASFDMFKNFAERGEKFKKLVNDL